MNNPLSLVDPTGLFSFGTDLSDEQRKKITDAYNKLKEALGKLEGGSKAYNSIARSLARLGEPGKANGVVVTVGATKFSEGADTDVNKINKGVVTIRFDEKTFGNSRTEDDAANLGHEGVHADDAFNLYSHSRSFSAFAKAWESNDVTYRGNNRIWGQAFDSAILFAGKLYLSSHESNYAQCVRLRCKSCCVDGIVEWD